MTSHAFAYHAVDRFSVSAATISERFNSLPLTLTPPPPLSLSLGDQPVKHRTHRAQLREQLPIDRFDIAKRNSDIETRLGLFRRAERDVIVRLAPATACVAPFSDVEHDARRCPSKLPSKIGVVPVNRLDERTKPRNDR